MGIADLKNPSRKRTLWIFYKKMDILDILNQK